MLKRTLLYVAVRHSAFLLTLSVSVGLVHAEAQEEVFRAVIGADGTQPFNGAVLIYEPTRKQATLWPFGYRRFPALNLSPENRLIQSATGQRVDRSDVGALYRNVQALQEHGKAEVAGIELAGGKETLHVTIEGNPGFSVEAVHRYQLWLDQETGFPVKVFSYDAAGELIETVEMDELQVNPKFPDNFFDQ